MKGETFEEWASRIGQKVEPCPTCGGQIVVTAECGGFGCGDLTQYIAECHDCSYTANCLGTDGTLRNAVRHWNKVARQTQRQRSPARAK